MKLGWALQNCGEVLGKKPLLCVVHYPNLHLLNKGTAIRVNEFKIKSRLETNEVTIGLILIWFVNEKTQNISVMRKYS